MRVALLPTQSRSDSVLGERMAWAAWLIGDLRRVGLRTEIIDAALIHGSQWILPQTQFVSYVEAISRARVIHVLRAGVAVIESPQWSGHLQQAVLQIDGGSRVKRAA